MNPFIHAAPLFHLSLNITFSSKKIMKNTIKLMALALLLSSSQVFAQAGKPSVDSIKEVFALTNSRAMLINVQSQMDGMMKNMMQQSMKDQTINAAQQKVLEKFQAKVIEIQKEELSWDKMEPMFLAIYGNALTQDDVDGMIAFYKSPAGQSFINKMPSIMQQTMISMQKMMGPLMEKMKLASEELSEEMKKTEDKKVGKNATKK